jgi:hypothetical protein
MSFLGQNKVFGTYSSTDYGWGTYYTTDPAGSFTFSFAA